MFDHGSEMSAEDVVFTTTLIGINSSLFLRIVCVCCGDITLITRK